MGNISSIHDTFIRAIMADRRIALDYFRASLPASVHGKLDFSTLAQLPDTYVSAELRKTVSDIVYSCRRKDGKGEVKVSLLIEHKSYVDRFTPIQIGSYVFSGLLRQAENGEGLSPVIPVLLYHGRDRWEYRTLRHLFGDLEPEWERYVPNFDYVYNNLGEVPDEQLEILGNNFLKASLLALKHAFEKEWLEANAIRLLVWSGDVAENLQKGFIVYLFEQSKLGENKILKIMEALPSTVRKTIESAVDYWREEGRHEGEQKKTEKAVRNMLTEGLSIELICKILEVTPDYVTRIREQIQTGK